jgi:hypothetical protein
LPRKSRPFMNSTAPTNSNPTEDMGLSVLSFGRG